MASEIFVDTGGFYALLVKKDGMHKKAQDLLEEGARKKTGFVTTDYVLDETATLLKARGHAHLLARFFETVFASRACRTEWMDPARFDQTQSLFLKHADHDWSFTDCFSFVVMRQRRLRDALSKDGHFVEAGFQPLLV